MRRVNRAAKTGKQRAKRELFCQRRLRALGTADDDPAEWDDADIDPDPDDDEVWESLEVDDDDEPQPEYGDFWPDPDSIDD